MENLRRKNWAKSFKIFIYIGLQWNAFACVYFIHLQRFTRKEHSWKGSTAEYYYKSRIVWKLYVWKRIQVVLFDKKVHSQACYTDRYEVFLSYSHAHTIQHKPVRNAQRQNEQDIRKKVYSGNNNKLIVRAPTEWPQQISFALQISFPLHTHFYQF